MQLLNVKNRIRESMVYANSTVKGPLDALIMRGDLQLLGGTNVTYVMQESPLTAQDRLTDLVNFTDFSDNRRRPADSSPEYLAIRVDWTCR